MPDKPTIRETVRIRLEELSDPEYREFHSRLLPGITGIMGVRTPELRGIAKDLKKSGWREYINEVSCAWKEKGQGADGVLYDEMIIWGLCICGGCRDWDTAGEYVTAFVPAINNWAVCDIFCGSLKITGRYREDDLRFGTVMLLSHYTDQDYLDRALKLLDRVRHPGYYAKMAVAWAVSVYFVKFPDQVMEYLKQSSLDDWTYNKALQKITESFRVDKETKKLVRQMRRGR